MIIIYVFIDILEIVTPIIIIIGVTIIVIVIIVVNDATIIVIVIIIIVIIAVIIIVINLLAVPCSLLLSFPPPLRRGDRGRRHKGKYQTAIYKYVNMYVILIYGQFINMIKCQII